MNSTNKNRRLVLKGIGAIGTSGAIVACGGGSSSSSTPASASTQYFTEPYLPAGSTEITGIRGVNNSTDVFITGINMDNTTSPTTNYGLLYRGPVLIPSVNRWNRIGPAKPIIQTNGRFVNSSGLNFYGPDNGATAGSIVVVGNYDLANDSYAYGLLYRGDIAGNGTYTQINPSSLVIGGTAIDTIAHSNMNGYVVGNYTNDIDVFGHAFIMAIGNTPDVPSTYSYVEIPRGSLTGGSISITAYGIWYNSSLNNYTIAGGFSKALSGNGLSTGYVVDWSPTAGFSNFTPIYYNNDSSTSKVSHVEGITTDNAGGYYLAVDWAETVTSATQGAAFVQIKRNASGGFASPTWTSFAYPGAPGTSANTVFEKNVLGIYLPPTPYLAVFP